MARLNTLPCVHLPPINHVLADIVRPNGRPGNLPGVSYLNVISEWASRLDAFSAYHQPNLATQRCPRTGQLVHQRLVPSGPLVTCFAHFCVCRLYLHPAIGGGRRLMVLACQSKPAHHIIYPYKYEYTQSLRGHNRAFGAEIPMSKSQIPIKSRLQAKLALMGGPIT